jgi:hypothetical protein
MQPVQLLSNAQLQPILFISSEKAYEEIGRQIIRLSQKKEITITAMLHYFWLFDLP